MDEAGGDRLLVGEGHGEQAAAEGEGGDVADAGGAFGEEDDGEVVAEAFGHALGGLGDAAAAGAAGGAVDVDGAGHQLTQPKTGVLRSSILETKTQGRMEPWRMMST